MGACSADRRPAANAWTTISSNKMRNAQFAIKDAGHARTNTIIALLATITTGMTNRCFGVIHAKIIANNASIIPTVKYAMMAYI